MTCAHCRAPGPCSCVDKFRHNHAIGLALDGRPIVSLEEVVEARRLRAEGLSYAAIGTALGRVKSTAYHLVNG